MIGQFKADYSVVNPLNISYSYKKDGIKIQIQPLLPTDLAQNVDEFDKLKDFKIDKAHDYFIKVIIEPNKIVDKSIDELLEKITAKFIIAKSETKSDSSIHLYFKNNFKLINLIQMAKLLVPSEVELQMATDNPELISQ